MTSDQKKTEKQLEKKPNFDIYHMFSRWDFILLVVFVVLTLILTILIILNGHPAA